MNTANWITFGSILLQIVGLIIVLWQFSIRQNRKASERDATWKARLDAHDEKFKASEKVMEEVKTHIEQLEQQFNHRFTDYKNEVISLIKELKEDRKDSFTKIDNQFTCLTKKLTTISLDMAFLKGERHKEGKSRLPSQNPSHEEGE